MCTNHRLCLWHRKTDENRLQKKRKEKKEVGARGGFAAANGNESELKGHRGVHYALICSTGNRAGTCTTVSEYVGDGEAEG